MAVANIQIPDFEKYSKSCYLKNAAATAASSWRTLPGTRRKIPGHRRQTEDPPDRDHRISFNGKLRIMVRLRGVCTLEENPAPAFGKRTLRH